MHINFFVSKELSQTKFVWGGGSGLPPSTINFSGGWPEWRDDQSAHEMEYNNKQANQIYTVHTASTLMLDVYIHA